MEELKKLLGLDRDEKEGAKLSTEDVVKLKTGLQRALKAQARAKANRKRREKEEERTKPMWGGME